MPKSLLVVGSGAIGIEFASFYNSMGVDVTVVEVMDQIMPVEDAEIPKLAQKQLEDLRQSGGIGSSLQAEVVIAAPEGDRSLLESLGADLRFLLITSTATVETGAALAVRVTPSPHAKCDRCWHYREDVGRDARHPSICGRCVSNIEGPGEERRHA